MVIDICFRIFFRALYVFRYRIFFRPAPIVGPNMYITIVDIGVSTDALPHIVIVFTAKCTFRTNAYQMPIIQTFHQGCGLSYPCFKRWQHGFIKGTWFVTNLPRHNSRVICIPLFGVAIGSIENKTHMVEEQLLGFGVGRELRSILHVSGITHFIRQQCFASACVFQIKAVASTPFPRVVKV